MLQKPYTVVLIYPDYIAEQYGEEFWTAQVMADNVADAQLAAQLEAMLANGGSEQDELVDFAPVFVCEGHHRNIMEN